MKKFILTACLLIGTLTGQAQEVISGYNCSLNNFITKTVVKAVQFGANGGGLSISTNPSNVNADIFTLEIFPKEEMKFRVIKYTVGHKMVLQVNGSAASNFGITDYVGGYYLSCVIK